MNVTLHQCIINYPQVITEPQWTAVCSEYTRQLYTSDDCSVVS